MKQFCVYIMTNKSKALSIEVTSNLKKRVSQHKTKYYPEFTEKDNCTKLVYFESFPNAMDAIRREKQ